MGITLAHNGVSDVQLGLLASGSVLGVSIVWNRESIQRKCGSDTAAVSCIDDEASKMLE